MAALPLSMVEIPTLNSSAYMSNAYSGPIAAGSSWIDDVASAREAADERDRRTTYVRHMMVGPASQEPKPTKKETQDMADKRRLVQIFIVDTHPAVPLDQAMVYEGKQFLTDLTDQELFYDLSIKELLDKHNERRTKIIDKSVKSRTEKLEAARVRDLTMTVTVIAAF